MENLKKGEIGIPIAALSAEGEAGAVPPAVGDTVDIQASGKVTTVNGDVAYVKFETINGNPIPEMKPAEEAPADNAVSLRKKAQKDDEENSLAY
jgi:hypothetical protein